MAWRNLYIKQMELYLTICVSQAMDTLLSRPQARNCDIVMRLQKWLEVRNQCSPHLNKLTINYSEKYSTGCLYKHTIVVVKLRILIYFYFIY